jgi:hypothetical protein
MLGSGYNLQEEIFWVYHMPVLEFVWERDT